MLVDSYPWLSPMTFFYPTYNWPLGVIDIPLIHMNTPIGTVSKLGCFKAQHTGHGAGA